MVIPFFCIWTTQQKSPQKGTCNFNKNIKTRPCLSPTHSYQKFTALLITKSHQPFSLLLLNKSGGTRTRYFSIVVLPQSSKTSTTCPHPRTPAFLSEIFYHANYTIGNCYIANCTIVGCYLANCTIANSYLANCTIRNSYLANCTTENCYRAIWTIEYWYRENCTIAQRCLSNCNRKCLFWKLHHMKLLILQNPQ